MSDFWLVLKAWLGILAEFLGCFYADHVRFDPSHAYIARASTDALIQVYSVVISLSDVHMNGFEDHAVATETSLDGICTGDHL